MEFILKDCTPAFLRKWQTVQTLRMLLWSGSTVCTSIKYFVGKVYKNKTQTKMCGKHLGGWVVSAPGFGSQDPRFESHWRSYSACECMAFHCTVCRPRWISWMRRPTGDQEVKGSTPAEVGNILSWLLIMKYFLWSFSPFRWFKKGSCQFLAKECAQYWLTA